MIKSVTVKNTTKDGVRKMGAEVSVEGTGIEIMHEFVAILDSLEKQCPEVLMLALKFQMEGKKNDC